MRERNRVEAERDRVMIDRDALQAELERSQRQVEEESETAKRFAAERDMLLVERDKIEAELAKVTHELEAILAKAKEAADAEAAIKANVYAFMGYAIPIDLMFMTGGGLPHSTRSAGSILVTSPNMSASSLISQYSKSGAALGAMRSR